KEIEQIELGDKRPLLRIIEDACARPHRYTRRVTQEAVDELKQCATTMDFASFLKKCQEMSVLPERYDHYTAAQLQQLLVRNRTNVLADMEYCAQPLPIPVHFFVATELEPGQGEPSIEGWKSVVPPRLLRIVPVEGDHKTIMESPHVESFGRILSNTILTAAAESGDMP